MAKFIKIHENDNVAVALETIAQGETITVDDVTVTTVNEIPAGHKFAEGSSGWNTCCKVWFQNR